MKFKEIDTQERFDFAIGEATALLKILSGQAIEDEDFDEEDEFEDEEEIFDELVTQLESALLYILDENYDYSNQEYYHQDYTEMWVEGLINGDVDLHIRNLKKSSNTSFDESYEEYLSDRLEKEAEKLVAYAKKQHN